MNLTPAKLYGVRRWLGASRDGSISADSYIMQLPKAQIVTISDPEGMILAFFDAAKRDQFIAIFGGQSLTLNRTRKDTVTGAAAGKLISQGAFG